MQSWLCDTDMHFQIVSFQGDLCCYFTKWCNFLLYLLDDKNRCENIPEYHRNLRMNTSNVNQEETIQNALATPWQPLQHPCIVTVISENTQVNTTNFSLENPKTYLLFQFAVIKNIIFSLSAYTQIAWHSQTRMFSGVFRIISLLLSTHITSKNELISNWEANHRPVVWLHPLESWNRPLMNG